MSAKGETVRRGKGRLDDEGSVVEYVEDTAAS